MSLPSQLSHIIEKYTSDPYPYGFIGELKNDINYRLNGTTTALIELCSHIIVNAQDEANITEGVRLLLELGADPNLESNGKVPLFHSRIPQVTKLLIDAGANPNYEGSNPIETPLSFILWDASVHPDKNPQIPRIKNIINILLEAGADPEHDSVTKQFKHAKYELVKLIRDHKNKKNTEIKMEYQSLDFSNYSTERFTTLIQQIIKLGRVRFSNCNFSGLNLTTFPFDGNSFYSCDFTEANMQHVNAMQAVFKGSVFRRAELKGAILQDTDLRQTDIRQAELQGADLEGADLQGANLQGVDLNGVNLALSNLQGAVLQGADLRKVDIRNVNLEGVDLKDVNLKGANIQNANLEGVDLQDADLEGVDLQGAILRRANLQRANLGNADLRRADLNNAILRGARFHGVKLQGAILHGADFKGINHFKGVNLDGVNFERVDFDGVIFEGVDIDDGRVVITEPNFDDIGLPNVLSSDSEKAIQMYTYEKKQNVPWHHVINTKINNNEPLDEQDRFIFDNMMSLFKEVKTKKTVYRGVFRRGSEILLDELFGKQRKAKGLSQFLSTSTSLEIAERFNSMGRDRDTEYWGETSCCILEITLYPGTKAAYYIKHSYLPHEKEVLIAPGQLIYHDRTYKKDPNRIMNTIVCHIGDSTKPDIVHSPVQANGIKVMTYNVSWEALESKNKRRYCNRLDTKTSTFQNKCRKSIVEIIADRSPLNFIFLQEIRLDNPSQYNLFIRNMVNASQFNSFQGNVNIYNMKGVGTTVTPPAGIITMYDGQMYRILETEEGDFLTDTNDNTGGKRGRHYLFVVFQHNYSTQIIITINLHAPRPNEVIGDKLKVVTEPIAKILANYRKKYPSSMVIIGGDYNESLNHETRNAYRKAFGVELDGFKDHSPTCCDVSGKGGQMSYTGHFDHLAVSHPYRIRYVNVDTDYYNKFRLDGKPDELAFMPEHFPVTAAISIL
jgi:uncharacterized protein YjbI with pentapeptide repeats